MRLSGINPDRFIRYSEYVFSVLFFTGIFVFFSFFYKYHLHFEEQFQLFLLTDEYLFSKLSCPGGFAGYLGGFLTQFYYLPFAGPAVITILLFALQIAFRKILFCADPSYILFPLSFLPSLLAGMNLCNEFYPLSSVVGFLMAIVAGIGYLRTENAKSRFIAGLIIIPVTYWLAGGSYLSLLLIMIIHEIITGKKSVGKTVTGNVNLRTGKFRMWYLLLYILLAAGVPLLVRQFIIIQPYMLTYMSEFYYDILTKTPAAILVLFILPPALMLLVSLFSFRERHYKVILISEALLFVLLCVFGFRSSANFEAEQIMTYDYLVRNGRWDDVLKYAERKPPRNYLSLAMLNLSLAKTGQLGNRMFSYDQHGTNGLFLPFNHEYVTAAMGNEILYHIGLTNASQQYAFESMETIPNMDKSVRMIKRLAETNLINGQYSVSEKYLKILRKTLFYRSWSASALALLGNEEKINKHPDWGEKRKFMVRNDYFFHIKNIEAVLTRMFKEHPDNKIAFEYLMAFYLINKDLKNFQSYIPVIERLNYDEVPVSYQEAILYLIAINDQDPLTGALPYVSQDTKLRMQAYADIYNSYQDAGERLQKRFSGTYWYYLHFKEPEMSSVEERKNNTGST